MEKFISAERYLTTELNKIWQKKEKKKNDSSMETSEELEILKKAAHRQIARVIQYHINFFSI